MAEQVQSRNEPISAISTRSSRFLTELTSSSVRRTLRMASGMVLFAYITAHLINHALGLISLKIAEAGMSIAIEVWYSIPGTFVLYSAAATHFLLALWSVYERRTFLLPPLELLRIALGFTMPLLLIGHVANTRIAYETLGLDSDYTRVISNLWASGSQGWQLGLMAPGWLHGCLGLHFAFNRRPWFRQSRFGLFGIALLLPVLSALGFIAMGRELAADPVTMAQALNYLNPQNAVERLAIAQWRDSLLNGYFAVIASAFVAREIRNFLENRRHRLIAISYPGRTVRVPRGWSVLEASRSFHVPHASMCGGRARCSTCRVQVTAGEESCPPVGADEKAALDRIGALDGVRLACQLRPGGDISVIPLVRTARPIYRQAAPQRTNGEHDVVVLFCDFPNRADLQHDHLPQDLLYVLSLYVEAISSAIRATGGALSSVEFDSICALYGFQMRLERAAQGALNAAAAIDSVIVDLNNRLGRQADRRIKTTVTIHAGRAVVGEIGSSDPPRMVAVGEAMDVGNEIRKVGLAKDSRFAISEPVYAASGLAVADSQKITLSVQDSDSAVAVFLSETAPVPSPPSVLQSSNVLRTKLRRFWAGS